MGRNYEYSEWLQFECEGVEISKELAKLAEKFAKRANEVADAFLHSQLGPDKILDGQRIAAYNEDALVWNTYASIVGHGVGLWEEDGDTGLPGELEGKLDEIVKKDKKLQRLADQIQGECAGLKSDAGVEERASDFSSKDAAVRSAQSHGATHVSLRPTHVFAFNPSGGGYEKRELFFARGKLHWPAASVHVKSLPVDAIAIEHALGRQAAETPRGEGPLHRGPVMVVLVRRDHEPYSSTGRAFRAFRVDRTPLYMGAETEEELHRKVEDEFGRRFTIEFQPYDSEAKETPQGREPLQAGAPRYRDPEIIRHKGFEIWSRYQPYSKETLWIVDYVDVGGARRQEKFETSADAKAWIDRHHGSKFVQPYADETPQGGEPLPAEERVSGSPIGMKRNEALAHAHHAGATHFKEVKYFDKKREGFDAYRPGPKGQQLVDRYFTASNGVWYLSDMTMFAKAIPSDAKKLRAPRVGGPSPSEARESTAVPAEDAVPWVRITRDPEQYAEGMKRAKEIGPINSGKEIYELLAPALSVENQEVFLVVLCNLRQECLGVAEVHRGERSRVSVSRADILQVVTKSGADHFHVVHNHPSGDPTPSEADRKLTDAIMSGGDNVDIPCVDHVVIGMGKYYSFAKGKVVTVK